MSIDMQKVYGDLTGVDIQQQYRLWDERGKGYYGEYLVLSELYRCIEGNCKFLMNLNIPISNSKTTEVDLLMIHETGIYVFEVKHYKGSIYGSTGGKVWTQYFRTSPNQKFPNPVLQNNYHLQALKALLPDSNFISVIVFTSNDGDLRVKNDDPSLLICHLEDLQYNIKAEIANRTNIYDIDMIDKLFNQLSTYSPMEQATVSFDGEELPLYTYIDQLKVEQAEIRQQNLAEQERMVKDNKKQNKARWITTIGAMCAIVVAAVVFCLGYGAYCKSQITQAQEETKYYLQEIIQDARFSAKSINNIIKVSNQRLTQSSSDKDGIKFTARLSAVSDSYGFQLNKNTTYVITMTNGKKYEFPMFDESFTYDYSANRKIKGGVLSAYGNLREKTFHSVGQKEKVAKIHITNVSIWKDGIAGGQSLVNGIDLILYTK